jgi:tetratricopeptide (TPR) repeat protein
MSSLAVGYQNAERLSEALPLYEQTFKLQKAKLGPDHSDTRTTMQNLALAYRDAARFADAEALYEDLLTYRRKNSSADSTSLADILASYGQCLLQQGKYANAEPLLRESLNIREKKMPDDWETFKIRSRLGMTLLGQKKYAEAEPLLVQGYQGLKERQSKLPKGSRTPLKDASEPLVRLYEDWGQPEKAAEWRQKLEASTSADKQP